MRQTMEETLMCDFCGEEIEEQPIRSGDRTYCCEACAFEATRSEDCGGRSDSNIAQSTVDQT